MSAPTSLRDYARTLTGPTPTTRMRPLPRRELPGDRLRLARARVEEVANRADLATLSEARIRELLATLRLGDLRVLLAATAPHPATGQLPPEQLASAQTTAARYRSDRDEAWQALNAIRAEVGYETTPDASENAIRRILDEAGIQ
ncbi:hypothetical protein SEA_CEN1621_62 [Microbacterium phage Cen1621]|uniref:Uncharacterized protein n=1 Tax=Microbacterium phage Cen1621 TaxID=2965191 RepID=A0A9E7TQV4_9CAUD|nr:hypothetical protein SEA_CEN1621_62 [Microbacterium phage Cen1621]